MGRPVTPRITHERAAQAALEIIDERGLEAVSVDLVARRMGVKAPSLYHHYHGKEELLGEVARLLLAGIEPLTPEGEDWPEAAVRTCLSVRRAILAHPGAAPLLLQLFPRHILLPAYDRALRAYQELPEGQRFLMMQGTEILTFASALFEAAALVRRTPSFPTFDPERFSHLAGALAAAPDDEARFAETIRAFIEGLRLRGRA